MLFRYLDRIIRGSELQEFATQLKEHQKATTADGKDILKIEINLKNTNRNI